MHCLDGCFLRGVPEVNRGSSQSLWRQIWSSAVVRYALLLAELDSAGRVQSLRKFYHECKLLATLWPWQRPLRVALQSGRIFSLSRRLGRCSARPSVAWCGNLHRTLAMLLWWVTGYPAIAQGESGRSNPVALAAGCDCGCGTIQLDVTFSQYPSSGTWREWTNCMGAAF
ncbi:hypothetical protein OBBRIDRAFT_226947 [Obba rivulosa]|uniref:Uncharacterized protein n=1 Tax=Obba rivulosa TaxID=1052685 RepID=A0A8E2AKZ8_9APHY|nr:hypothetical protein OBBRIDRAFT_226947 [Obba rivulosa]